MTLGSKWQMVEEELSLWFYSEADSRQRLLFGDGSAAEGNPDKPFRAQVPASESGKPGAAYSS